MHVKDSLFQRFVSCKSNYYGCFIIDICLFIALLSISLKSPHWYLLAIFITGFFLATLIEWVIHYVPLHLIPSPLNLAHEGHHQNPTGYFNLPCFFSPLTSVIIILLTPKSWHGPYLYIFMAGILFEYICYSTIHHLQHRIRFKSGHLKAMQAHHYIHHKHKAFNFGVTTQFWDKAFNTMYQRKVIH